MSDDGSLYFLLWIPFAALLLCWVLASVSGWTRLAAEYRADQTVTAEPSVADERSVAAKPSVAAERAHMRTGRIGPINYHSVLSFSCTNDGLRISIAFPLRIAHPPLFIPWTEFHQVTADNKLYSNRIKACIGNPAIVRVVLPAWVRYRMPMSLRGITED
jgi:hypothetical protein